MNRDIKEILDELEEIANNYNAEVDKQDILNFIEQKRNEYAEPKGDCCG